MKAYNDNMPTQVKDIVIVVAECICRYVALITIECSQDMALEIY